MIWFKMISFTQTHFSKWSYTLKLKLVLSIALLVLYENNLCITILRVSRGVVSRHHWFHLSNRSKSNIIAYRSGDNGRLVHRARGHLPPPIFEGDCKIFTFDHWPPRFFRKLLKCPSNIFLVTSRLWRRPTLKIKYEYYRFLISYSHLNHFHLLTCSTRVSCFYFILSEEWRWMVTLYTVQCYHRAETFTRIIYVIQSEKVTPKSLIKRPSGPYSHAC